MSDKKRSEAAKKAWVTRRANAAVPGVPMAKKVVFKRSDAAKKAWETRRQEDAKAEQERLEALRILEEMSKSNSPLAQAAGEVAAVIEIFADYPPPPEGMNELVRKLEAGENPIEMIE